MPSKQPEIKIGKFLGINNVDPPELCKPGELQVATNVDITDTHQVRRRDGYSSVYSGSPFSVWANKKGTICLFREGTILKKLSTAWQASNVRTGIAIPNWMTYLDLNDRIYYSDEIITGIYDGTTDRTWGLAIPSFPSVAGTSGGSLQAGSYLIALTFVRNDGQESGASAIVKADVTANQAISITNIPVSSDSTVSYVNIYITTCNGETFYLAKQISNGTTSATYILNTIELNLPIRTLLLSPAPAGHNLQFYNGRVYVASGDSIYYSEPYAYELFDLAHNRMHFDSRIAVMAPVRDGIWVATQTRTVFLAGEDAPQFKYTKRTDYGAVENTQAPLPELSEGGEEVQAWIWASSDGVISAFEGGVIKNMTGAKYTNDSNAMGCSFRREENDRTLFIVNLMSETSPSASPSQSPSRSPSKSSSLSPSPSPSKSPSVSPSASPSS
jgi:hypothetical protein